MEVVCVEAEEVEVAALTEAHSGVVVGAATVEAACAEVVDSAVVRVKEANVAAQRAG